MQLFQRLLLGGHDVRQLDVTRLVQTQVSGHHCRQRQQTDGFRPPSISRVTVTLSAARSTDAKVPLPRHASQCAQHLTSLVGIVIDCLFAQNHQTRFSLATIAFSSLATASGCSSASVSTSATIAPIAIAVRICSSRAAGTHRYHNEFRLPCRPLSNEPLLQQRFHRKGSSTFDVGDIHIATVSLDSYLDVVIHNAFYNDQSFPYLS